MGSVAGVNTTIDKVVYYFELGSGNGDYIELTSKDEEEAYILTYYTREEITFDCNCIMSYCHSICKCECCK